MIEWVAEVTGQPVVDHRRLPGGLSSLVVAFDLADSSTVVGRHITDTAWLEREPGLIDQEATALRLLANSEVRAPKLIAADPVGGRLLMSWLPGRMRIAAGELAAAAETLAETAAAIAAVPLPADHGLVPWRPWLPAELSPPDWGDHVLWSEAIAAFEAKTPPAADRPVFLHRDLHPLNVLWDDRAGGAQGCVVDWVNACVGHPHAELGHCRWNLAVLAGPEVADAFLDRYLVAATVVGRDAGPYDLWWDVADVMSFLPGPIDGAAWNAVGRTDLTPSVVNGRTELFLRAALRG